jgi:hypothetical protein
MFRRNILIGLVLGLALTVVHDAAAQRQGFIIGFGLGPGVTTGDPDTKVGLATDFKIGAKVGESVQVYYMNRANFFGGEFVDFIATGVGGLGVAYELPSAPGFSINGGIGLSTWMTFADGETSTETGFGLAAGFGYEFADLWIFNVGATWGQPVEEFNVFNLMAGISILSH